MSLRLSEAGGAMLGGVRIIAVGLLVVCASGGALAAERCVLVEDFTADWCTPCHVVSGWLSEFQDTYPDTMALLQEHVTRDDIYAIQWGKDRFISYYGESIPTVWYDGTLRLIGTEPNYPGYLNAYLTRAAVPTDVRLELGGEPISGPTYRLAARVRLQPGGMPKTVRVYIVRALDHYPTTEVYDRNCLMEAAATEDVVLQPGQTQTVERIMTFDPNSWAHQGNIRVLAWAQVPGNSGPREVHQAKMISWPIEPLPPLHELGDLNCDGAVNFADINAFVLALAGPGPYYAAYPNCDIDLADCNDDGVINFADINPFVALLNWS